MTEIEASWNMGKDYYSQLSAIRRVIYENFLNLSDLNLKTEQSTKFYNMLSVEFLHIKNKISKHNVTVDFAFFNKKDNKIEIRNIGLLHLFQYLNGLQQQLIKFKKIDIDDLKEFFDILAYFEREMNMLEPNLSNNEHDEVLEPQEDWKW